MTTAAQTSKLSTSRKHKVLSLQGLSLTDELDSGIDYAPVFDLWTNGNAFYWVAEHGMLNEVFYGSEREALGVFANSPEYTWHLI